MTIEILIFGGTLAQTRQVQVGECFPKNNCVFVWVFNTCEITFNEILGSTGLKICLRCQVLRHRLRIISKRYLVLSIHAQGIAYISPGISQIKK